MTPRRSGFVTLCQQLLALGVVLAVLTPAAGVVTLDVVGTSPTGSTSQVRPTVRMAAYTAEALRASKVPTAPVKAHVREVPLTAAGGTSSRALPTSAARVVTGHGGPGPPPPPPPPLARLR